MSPEWKYKITIENPDWQGAEQWCMLNVGEFDQAWYKLGIDPAEYLITRKTKTVWYFKQEKDAFAFALRWQ